MTIGRPSPIDEAPATSEGLVAALGEQLGDAPGRRVVGGSVGQPVAIAWAATAGTPPARSRRTIDSASARRPTVSRSIKRRARPRSAGSRSAEPGRLGGRLVDRGRGGFIARRPDGLDFARPTSTAAASRRSAAGVGRTTARLVPLPVGSGFVSAVGAARPRSRRSAERDGRRVARPGRRDRCLRVGQAPERAADQRQAEIVGLLGVDDGPGPRLRLDRERSSRVCQRPPPRRSGLRRRHRRRGRRRLGALRAFALGRAHAETITRRGRRAGGRQLARRVVSPIARNVPSASRGIGRTSEDRRPVERPKTCG
jgi:hypothetical protein